MTEALAGTLLRLQLPILATAEHLADQVALEAMRACGVDEQEAVDLLELHINEWLDAGVCSEILRTVIDRCIMAASGPAVHQMLGGGYVDWFGKFTEKHGLPRAATRMLLARSQLIAELLLEERMSASQIVRLLHSLEPVVDVPFNAIQDLASRLGRCPAMDSVEVESIWAADATRSRVIFPDGDLFESCSAAAAASNDFGVSAQLEELLRTLLTNGVDGPPSPIIPYLQMLHFALCPVELYDHCPTRLYEFAPRGAAANWLFDRYGMATGNPVLNNAKSVAVLDLPWARSKGTQSAVALVGILQRLEQLPYVQRREAARVVRSWLHRALELMKTPTLSLPEAATASAIKNVLTSVSTTPTGTGGVIEQRIIDAVVLMTYQDAKWRSRGIGDAVNASNFSRRKLGDVEVQSVADRLARAYEAHGGTLTAPYLEGHRRSLRRAVEFRYAEEWVHVADATEWRIVVVFVAHALGPELNLASEYMSGILVEFHAVTYAEVFAAAVHYPLPDYALTTFSEHVHGALNRSTTPQSARERYAELAQLKLIVLSPG